MCYNFNLSDSIRSYLSEKIGKPYRDIEEKICVLTINKFLYILIDQLIPDNLEREPLKVYLGKFKYKELMNKLRISLVDVPNILKFDAIIIDEAQDIDTSLWDLFNPNYFLKDADRSIFYLFYDGSQSIFVKDFAPERFGLDNNKDLIVLTRNLRNTIEIAKWLEHRTEFGNYEQYSGIGGFKVRKHRYANAETAHMRKRNSIMSKLNLNSWQFFHILS